MVKRVMDKVKASKWTLHGQPGVTIKPALTEIDKNRNWALNEAEKLIRGSPELGNSPVEMKRGQNRGVYVDGLPAFTQKERFAKNGVFHGVYSGLKLP